MFFESILSDCFQGKKKPLLAQRLPWAVGHRDFIDGFNVNRILPGVKPFPDTENPHYIPPGSNFFMIQGVLFMAIHHRKPNDTIKQELKKRGISQTQASFDLGIRRIRFNTIANGWEIPGPAIRQRISSYLDIPENLLFS